MPFRSEKQRRWMHANHPEMAMRWEHEGKRKRRRGKGKKRKRRK
jgi:hypothetical protein